MFEKYASYLQKLIKNYKTYTMRKTILTIAIGLAVFSSAFAKVPAGINDRAVASFQKDFNTASDVRWDVTSNYIMATFQMDKPDRCGASYTYQQPAGRSQQGY